MRVYGYCGFYKENFLRSSYEFVYCKILEKQNLEYKVEEKQYDLGKCKYIPDFHIYKNNQLVEIVEIKSENKTELKKAIEKVNLLTLFVSVKITILQIQDLKILCKTLNLSIHSLIKEWKENSIGNNINKGILNPMYNKIHSDSTKNKIGIKSIERWSNDEFKNKIKQTKQEAKLKRGYNPHHSDKIRIVKVCPQCNSEFIITEKSKQLYCNNSCKLIDTTLKANIKTREINKNKHLDIKNKIIIKFTKNLDILYSKKKLPIYNLAKEVLVENGYTEDYRLFKFAFLNTYFGNFETIYVNLLSEVENYLKCTPNLQDEKL